MILYQRTRMMNYMKKRLLNWSPIKELDKIEVPMLFTYYFVFKFETYIFVGNFEINV